MKTFFRKLKRCNKFYSTLYLLISFGYLITLIIFIFFLSKLANIETILRIIACLFFIIWFFIYLVSSPISLFTKRNKTFLAISACTSICIPIFVIGSFLINFIYGGLSSISKAYLTYTTNLVALKDTEFNEDSTIGMLSDTTSIEGHQLANKLIAKEKLSNEIIEYDDYYEMLGALYNNKVDAIFLSSNYVILFSAEETYKKIDEETQILYEYSEKLENQDNELRSDKKLTEPFTVLLMGVDSEHDGLDANQAFNGDTLMMITFNPNTLSATMFSMPRDMYVPIACRNNAMAKINSSAAYGTSCVIDTLEQLTDVPIDYYVKLNFKGVVDLVDALGGITVNVEKPDYRYNHGIDCGNRFCEQNSNREFADETIYLDPGVQTLNGEEALAYARCRALYAQSDIARNRHQQEIVEATAKKFKTIRSLSDFERILNSVSKNMDTNITTEQMLSFYEVAKNMIFKDNDSSSDELISIQKTYLEYYDLPIYLPGTNLTTSALGYYEGSLEAIKNAMLINLEIKTDEMPKTFSISYNEDYTTTIIGQGIYEGDKIRTMPSFIGKTIDEAISWGEKENITVYYDYADPGTTNYGEGISAGLIGSQSVHYGTILKNVSTVTFYINNATTDDDEPTQDPDDQDQAEQTPPAIDIPGGPTIDTPATEEDMTENEEDVNNNQNDEENPPNENEPT